METPLKSTRKKRKKKPLNLPAELSLRAPAPSASRPAAALANPGETVSPPKRRRPKRNQPKRSQLKNLAAPAQEKRRKLEKRNQTKKKKKKNLKEPAQKKKKKLEKRKKALPRKKTRKRRKRA